MVNTAEFRLFRLVDTAGVPAGPATPANSTHIIFGLCDKGLTLSLTYTLSDASATDGFLKT